MSAQRFVATNLTDLHREPSFLSEMFTQMLNGMACQVLEEQNKWCRVRLEEGYEGWAHAPYLTETPPPSPTHMVTFPSYQLRSEPSATSPVVTSILAGTQICVVESSKGWMRVKPAGEILPGGWLPQVAVRALDSLPLSPAEARQQIIHDARELMGVYYLWGGNTAWGTDCSGLVWLTHRLAGYVTPRDAHPQFYAAKPVEPPYQPGDLFFFHKDTDPTRIGHVGICIGGWRMIHSSRSNNGVYEEDIQATERLRTGFAGARTYIPR